MIPNNEWTHTYVGQMGIDVGLLILGFVAFYLPVMGFIVARYKPPGRTQTNMLTGMTEQGISWWGVRVALFTMGGQVLFGIVRTLIEATKRLSEAMPYWWIVAGLLGVCAVCVWVYRRFRTPREDEPVPVAPVVSEPVQEPWGLAEGMRNGGL
jgi:hypothetical protein